MCSCCPTPVVLLHVNLSTGKAGFLPHDCRRWSCEYCRVHHRQRRWKRHYRETVKERRLWHVVIEPCEWGAYQARLNRLGADNARFRLDNGQLSIWSTHNAHPDAVLVSHAVHEMEREIDGMTSGRQCISNSKGWQQAANAKKTSDATVVGVVEMDRVIEVVDSLGLKLTAYKTGWRVDIAHVDRQTLHRLIVGCVGYRRGYKWIKQNDIEKRRQSHETSCPTCGQATAILSG